MTINKDFDKLLVVRRHNQVIDSPERGTMKALERKMVLYFMGFSFKTKQYSFKLDIGTFNFSGKMTSGKKQALNEACQRLASALIIQPVFCREGKLIGKINDYLSVKYIPIFQEIELSFSKNYIFAEFNPKVVPLLDRFEENYTTYYFEEIKLLRKSHAIKIFELIQRGYPKYSQQEILVEHFLDCLGYSKKSTYRKGFKEIKRVILDPSCKELNQKTRFNIKWSKGVIQKKYVKTIIFYWDLKDTKVDSIQNKLENKYYNSTIIKKLNGQTLNNYKDCVSQLLVSPKNIVTEKYVFMFNKKLLMIDDLSKFINVYLYKQTGYKRVLLIQYCNM